jgi:RNA polymerase sigma-70 factor (ECF subfamily)
LQIEEARRRSDLPATIRQQLTDVEQRFWDQMQQGERRHSVFADILGVTHLPENEQRREVKRVKDRLKKRQERAGGKHD